MVSPLLWVRCSSSLFAFQQKQRMADHRTLKLLKGRVRSDLIVARKGVATLDILLQNEGRLAFRQFSCVDCFRPTPTREDGLSRCPQIAHPIHDSKRGGQIALPIALNKHDWDRTRLPAFAPMYHEQVCRVTSQSYQL